MTILAVILLVSLAGVFGTILLLWREERDARAEFEAQRRRRMERWQWGDD